MPADTIRTLLRLRQAAVDRAKQELALRLAAETDAERSLSAALLRLSDEADAATDPDAPDGAVEAYVRWLPTARRALRDAGERRDQAAEGVSVARTALSIARADERAVELTLERLEREQAIGVARRDQAVLDEVAGRRFSIGAGDVGRSVSARG